MTFQGAYEELKRFAEGKYFAMQYELSEYESGKREYECGVYIAGGKWHHARTWRGALELVGALPGEEDGHPLLEEGDLTETICVHCGQFVGPNHYRNTDKGICEELNPGEYSKR